MEANGFSGVVLVQDGQRNITTAFGLADRDLNIPNEPETVFDIGSVSKQFTGAAILHLEMDGQLTVDDLLSDHLSGIPEDKSSITLHHLLTHTAGFPSALGDDYEQIGRQEFVSLATGTPLLDEPGAFHEYSNVGYSLLAAVIEEVTGASYEEYLRTALFEPAGMLDTGYVIPKWDTQLVAVGYDHVSGDEQGRPNELLWDSDGPYWHLRGNGGLLSTAGDMLKWDQALRSGEILDPAATEKFYAKHVTEGPGAPTFYGYGWAIFPTPMGTPLITHNGGNGIFFADFLRFTEDDLTVFLASNSAGEEFDRAAFDLAGLVLGEDLVGELGGNVEEAAITCGFDELSLADLPAYTELDRLPATETGDTAQLLLDLIGNIDPGPENEKARLQFATDHVSPELDDGPPQALADALTGLQAEFNGFAPARILEEDPLKLHVVMSREGQELLLSMGFSDTANQRLSCIAISG